MSPAQVEAMLGKPNGQRALEGGQTWVYSGGVILRFAGGRLVEARGVEFGDAEPSEKRIQFTEESASADPPPDTAAEAGAPADEPEQSHATDAAGPVDGGKTGAAAESAGAEASGGDGEDWKTVEQLDEVEQAAKDAAAGQLPEGADLPETLAREEPQASSAQELLRPAVLLLLQFIFLLLACRMTGAEAHWAGLLLIALLDRLAVLWVQWLFLSVLGFPSVLHADTLVSFLVMLILVMKFTSAKSLPSALKVVVTAKVAALVAGYVVVLFVLSQMAP